MTFTVYPAIDLKGGQCVRLLQGRAEDVTVYSASPVEMALHWKSEGARWLHVVDLDGAFEGKPAHTGVIGEIVNAIQIPVQVGGGIRSDEHIQELVDAGVSRVILGTRAFSDPEGLARAVEKFGERVAVGIDARNGMVQVKGWTETTSMRGLDLAAKAVASGVKTIIYTDTATDGMLKGPNFDETAELARSVSADIIASGGVSTAEDVARYREMNIPNLIGCIVGKALYEKTVTLPALQEEG